MKKLKFVIFFSIFIFIITLLLTFTNVYKNLELNWIDTNFDLRGTKEVSKDVIVVAISDQTFAELGRWPFPRSYFAKLIENLNKAGAKLIVLDVEFTEPSSPDEDDLLATAAAEYGNVIFAGKFIRRIMGNSIQESILKPIEDITNRGIDWGLVGISQDEDGFVRKYTLFSLFNKEKFYSIGVKALEKIVSNRISSKPIPVNENEKFIIGNYILPKYSTNTVFINYYGPTRTFPYYDMDTIIDDSLFTVNSEQGIEGFEINTFNYYLEDNTFKDKIVLVGATCEELHDLFPTPFYNYKGEKKLTPGIEIHANFLEMVLNKNYINSFNLFYFIIVLFIAIFLINYIYSHSKPVINLIISVVLIILFLYFVYYLFSVKNVILNVTEFPTAIILAFLGNLVRQYYIGRKEKKFIKNAFQKYVSEEIVNMMVKNPQKLKFGGKLQELTILFSDIRSFTPFTEKHKSKYVVETLREYLTTMVDVIKEYNGTVDKFVGDAIMALYGVPYFYKEHAFNACKTALQMQEKLRELNLKWEKENKETIKIGIGIHTGKAIVGNLGSEQIFDYTAIGDTVNCAARIEALNKEIQTRSHIIISGEIYEIVKDNVKVRFLGARILRGKGTKTELYELVGLKEDVSPETEHIKG